MRDSDREVQKRFGKVEKIPERRRKRAGKGYTGSKNSKRDFEKRNREMSVTAACPITDVCGATASSGSGRLQVETSETLNVVIFPFSKANYGGTHTLTRIYIWSPAVECRHYRLWV